MGKSFYAWDTGPNREVGFWMRDPTYNQWLTILYCFLYERRADAPWTGPFVEYCAQQVEFDGKGQSGLLSSGLHLVPPDGIPLLLGVGREIGRLAAETPDLFSIASLDARLAALEGGRLVDIYWASGDAEELSKLAAVFCAFLEGRLGAPAGSAGEYAWFDVWRPK